MPRPLKDEKQRAVQFGVRISEELKGKLLEKSKETGKTMGDIAIEALEIHFGMRTPFVPTPSVRRMPPIRQLYKGAPGRDDK